MTRRKKKRREKQRKTERKTAYRTSGTASLRKNVPFLVGVDLCCFTFRLPFFLPLSFALSHCPCWSPPPRLACSSCLVVSNSSDLYALQGKRRKRAAKHGDWLQLRGNRRRPRALPVLHSPSFISTHFHLAVCVIGSVALLVPRSYISQSDSGKGRVGFTSYRGGSSFDLRV